MILMKAPDGNPEGSFRPADLTGCGSSDQTCRDTAEGMTCQITGPRSVIGYKKVTSSSVHFYLSDDEVLMGDTFLKRKPWELAVAAAENAFQLQPSNGRNASGKFVIATIDPTNKIVEIDR
jgi:hypothetical protein